VFLISKAELLICWHYLCRICWHWNETNEIISFIHIYPMFKTISLCLYIISFVGFSINPKCEKNASALLNHHKRLDGIKQELLKQTDYHNARCGNWMNEYAEKHRKILFSKPKLLVAVPNLSGKFCFPLNSDEYHNICSYIRASRSCDWFSNCFYDCHIDRESLSSGTEIQSPTSRNGFLFFFH